ncbi:MAG: DNA primase, partial [Candidatus Omnitrophota bacterium]|nr:DNA primase [Candidatus Omnitrophota bacterium]
KSPAAQKAREYLQDRKIRQETAKTFQLGLAFDQWDGLIAFFRQKEISLGLMEKAGLIIPRDGKEGYYDRFRDRIMFPILDGQSHCRAFGARALNKEDTAKYINSPETAVYIKGHHLYGFHLAKSAMAQQDCVIIVEGYMDCLMPWQEGVTNIVASCGTALTQEQVRLLRRYTKNVIMLFDADTAGESAMVRSLDMLIEEDMNVKVAQLDRGEDPDSFVRNHGVEAFKERIANAQSVIDFKLRVLKEKWDSRTIEGKAKIAAAILPTINRFPNEIIKTAYLRDLANQLGIQEAALKTELAKVEQAFLRQPVGREGPETLKSASSGWRTVEWNILKLLLSDNELIPTMKQEVDLTDFQDTQVRDIISKIYELFDQGQRFNVANLLNSFSDASAQQMISRLMTDEVRIIGDRGKIQKDLIKRIKQDRLKQKRQQLLEDIRQAEQSEDHRRLEDLKEQFNQLIKGVSI